MFLPRIIPNLCAPIPSSPVHGTALAIQLLTTIFNTLPTDAEARYHVFLAILKVVRASSSFEVIRPQLKQLDTWIAAWEIDEEDQRLLFLQIADIAHEAGEENESYLYLLRALRTVPPDESSTRESHDLALRALKSALVHSNHFDFQDLTSADPIQALRKSEPDWYELLEIFSTELLDDYNDFLESHDDFLEKNFSNVNNTSSASKSDQNENENESSSSSANSTSEILHRKMRLLTLASLAASTPSRSLPYAHISRSLQIPASDVEIWVIDVIRAGLVEGKLSQSNQTFLIHRSTYRVFGEKQWQEVQGRLDTWRTSLEGVLDVVRSERLRMLGEREKEAREIENRVNGYGGGRRREIGAGRADGGGGRGGGAFDLD